MFDRYCAEVTEATVRSLTGPDEGAYGRLRAHVLAVARATARDTGHLGCLLANGTAELAGQEPAVADRARRTFEALEHALVECIQQAQRHGDIDPAADARRHGRLLLAVLRGIEALGKANTDKRSLRSIAEAAHGDAVFLEAPQLLAQGIVQLACPFLVPKLHDLGRGQ